MSQLLKILWLEWILVPLLNFQPNCGRVWIGLYLGALIFFMMYLNWKWYMKHFRQKWVSSWGSIVNIYIHALRIGDVSFMSGACPKWQTEAHISMTQKYEWKLAKVTCIHTSYFSHVGLSQTALIYGVDLWPCKCVKSASKDEAHS